MAAASERALRESPVRRTGVALSAVKPSPSWPRVFAPQHLTAPMFVSAQVCRLPAAIGCASGTGMAGAAAADPTPRNPGRDVAGPAPAARRPTTTAITENGRGCLDNHFFLQRAAAGSVLTGFVSRQTTSVRL